MHTSFQPPFFLNLMHVHAFFLCDCDFKKVTKNIIFHFGPFQPQKLAGVGSGRIRGRGCCPGSYLLYLGVTEYPSPSVPETSQALVSWATELDKGHVVRNGNRDKLLRKGKAIPRME